MICRNCTIAGRLVKDMQDAPDDRAESRAEEQIVYWHGRCLDPIKCPCQHRVTQTS